MSKNYNPVQMVFIPGPLGVIRSGRIGEYNRDRRIRISIFLIQWMPAIFIYPHLSF